MMKNIKNIFNILCNPKYYINIGKKFYMLMLSYIKAFITEIIIVKNKLTNYLSEKRIENDNGLQIFFLLILLILCVLSLEFLIRLMFWTFINMSIWSLLLSIVSTMRDFLDLNNK